MNKDTKGIRNKYKYNQIKRIKMKIDGFKVKFEGMYNGYEAYFIDEHVKVGPICYLVKDGEVTTCIGDEFFQVLHYFNTLHPEDDEEEIDFEDYEESETK